MKNSELIQEIARRTGESESTISHRGFNLLSDELPNEDDERAPLMVDWDLVQSTRYI
ncbi:MAG: hypothetical protein R3C11_01615 [Planctomycetaceae bacterium]